MLQSGAFQTNDFSKLDLIEFPKRDYGGRRICTIMEPMDSIAYLALALLIAPAVERNRIGVGERVVHSYRYRPAPLAGTLFDRRFTYVSFLKEARCRRGARDVMVSCDIANFFSSVTPSAVEAALSDAAVEPAAAQSLVSLLRFWTAQGAPGLPVGPYASKILAEAVLSPIDASLRTSGVEFVRYVDDFRLIAPDRAAAEQHLQVLNDVLAENGLGLNSEKTEFVEPRNDKGDQIDVAANYQQAAPPRRFHPPTRQELRKLHKKKSEAKPDPQLFLIGDLLPTTQVRGAVRIAICTGQLDFVSAIPAILDRYPEFSRYATLALAYAADLIAEPTRRRISKYAAVAVLDERTPTFVRLDFLRFIGEPGYVQRKTLTTYALASEPRGPEFRAALDALRNSGGIPASLLRRYKAADPRARRALALSAPRQERYRANVDPFLQAIV
jgi:hypothetical protein